MIEPQVVYNEDSETYTINVNDMKIFIDVGDMEYFNWFIIDESAIHKGKIKVIRDEVKE